MTKKEERRVRAAIRKEILREISTTADIAGYQTPYAFTDLGDREEDEADVL